jgi:hypothetical protein
LEGKQYELQVFVNQVLRKISGNKGQKASGEHLIFYNKLCVSYRTHSIVKEAVKWDRYKAYKEGTLYSDWWQVLGVGS